MLKIDPSPYECFGEEHAVYTERQDAEMAAFRSRHPELTDWSRGQVLMAWGDFSEAVHQAGHLTMCPERNEEFLAYLIGRERGVLPDSYVDPKQMDAFRNSLFPHHLE